METTDDYCKYCNVVLVRARGKCSLCRNVYYCGRTCQKAHWKTHKLNCTKFQDKRKVQSELDEISPDLFVMWSPETHHVFSRDVRDAVVTVLLVARKNHNLYSLPTEVIFTLFEVCFHRDFRLRIANRLNLCRRSQGTELSFADCFLQHAPAQAFTFERLATLDLSNNSMWTIHKDIRRCVALTTLILKNNSFDIVPDAVLWLDQLQSLSLDGNNLSRLPDRLCSLHNLKYLFAGHNRLDVLPDELFSMPKLSVLSVQHNLLRSLPANAKEWGGTRLDLAHNLFKEGSVPSSLRHVAALEDNPGSPFF